MSEETTNVAMKSRKTRRELADKAEARVVELELERAEAFAILKAATDHSDADGLVDMCKVAAEDIGSEWEQKNAALADVKRLRDVLVKRQWMPRYAYQVCLDCRARYVGDVLTHADGCPMAALLAETAP